MPSETNKQKLLATLEELGSRAGNKRLREALGWQERTYENARAELIEEGRIVPGKGRGGSVRLAEGVNGPQVEQSQTTAPTASEAYAADPKGSTETTGKTASSSRQQGNQHVSKKTSSKKQANAEQSGNGGSLEFRGQ
jgi:type I restriction enzyme M protein